MSKPYISRYLSLIDLEDSVLMFNGFSGSMDVVRRDFAEKLRGVMKGGDLDFVSESELAFLKKRGHVTGLLPEEERAEFKKKVAAQHKVNTEAAEGSAVLMLLFGYDCNLSCEYCYQKDLKPRKWGPKISEELLDLVFRKHFSALFPGVKPHNLEITLYGGEPFQPANVPLIRKTMEFAAENGIRTSAISNCSSIECVEDFLGPLPGNINNVQVTLDAGGYKGSALQRSAGLKFEKIISNIHMMLDKKVSVSIRMHVVGDNYAQLRDTVDYLIAQDIVGHPRCFPHLAPVRDYDAKDPAKMIQHVDVTNPVAREISLKFGYPLNTQVWDIQSMLSARNRQFSRTYHCMHNRPNAFILDPSGELYGCTVEAGREQYLLGTVTGDGVKFNDTLKRHLRRNVGSIEKCLDCPFALLCGGGCAYNARQLYEDIFAPDCADHLEKFAEAIRFAYMQNQKGKPATEPGR